ncbi:ATP-binding cassette sub-family C member 4-like isoform X2 [Bolinopsis microptera]|uniref:ATP-binding cassette sub-family C member 4-like isoform X2 n=1 Tax=Bolinopsis microptera TaxID=2820187 RepID=UPI003079C056
MVVDNGNPEVEASYFSRITFIWVQKILSVGFQRTFSDDDVIPIDPRLQSERLTALLEQQWFKELEQSKRPSLLVTLIKRHLYTLIWIIFAYCLDTAGRCILPLFIARISSYFDSASNMTFETALMWSSGLVSLQLISVFFKHVLFYQVLRFGTSIRVAVTGLIYRKACRISQKEIGEKSVGFIVTLITNDAQRLDEYIGPVFIVFYLWVILVISFLLLHIELGLYTALPGFLSLLIFVPGQFYIGKFILYLRGRIAPLTDSRVKTIHEMIMFMKIIKMYCWEHMFKNLIETIRLKEARFIGLFVLMRALNNALLFISPIFSLMIIITVKRSIGELITTSQILFVLSLLTTVRVYINIFLGHSFTFVPQVIHSLRRIQEFLNADEVKHLQKKAAIMNLKNEIIVNKNFLHKDEKGLHKNGISGKNDHLTECYEDAITITNLSSKWGPDTFSLTGLNLSVKRGELIAVVGPVACGKTTLLMSLLQELDNDGGLVLHGSIGFSSQVPWIFNGSIEDNIVFNRAHDKERLNRVIESCYLERDLELFSKGIYTLVGERGVQLSGGQRARVNLARAVYGEDEIILLDDPLSAVDSRCAKHIFNTLIKEQLSDKTRILVTHATNFLSEVDRIVVMDTEVDGDGDKSTCSGKITDVGTYSELTAKGLNLSLYGVREKKGKRNRTLSKISKLSTDSGLDEEDSVSDEESVAAEKPEEVKEEKKSGSLDKRIYFRYLAMGLGYMALPVLLISIVAPQVLVLYQQQYVIDWLDYKYEDGVNSTSDELDRYDQTHYEIYLGLGFTAAFLYLFKAFFFIFVVNRAGRLLHNKALFSVLRSPMRYFDTHPIGIIINRFSKDTYFMDERFPDVLLEFLGLFILYTATIGLILYANYWFILALIPILILMGFTIRYYLGTSVEIRRIEAIKRSPILSHISATLSGLTTIRANNQIDIYEAKHYLARDEHTRCWMLFVAASRWFAQRIDFITVIVSVVATFLTVSLRDHMGASIAGLALVYVNSMIGGVQWCVRQFTETENMATAIERVLSFTDLPSEAPLDPPEKSPYSVEVITNIRVNSGVIEFRDVKLKYDPEGDDYVLHGMSFLTKPAEKIGIVGRTGAGKSSILQALFRMVEPEGEILLDGMLTSEMGLHQLRKSISIIPQESLLFSETLRINLDPFSEFTSEQLWDVLEKVELKVYVAAQTGGLEMMVQEGGGNLSAGQRQLLCLARALLRDNKILVIDEATANVDEKTDQLIQSTLRDKFSDCTVLTIAHRINTIIDSDRVMVMDAGLLVEFDHPAVLLKNSDSIFYDLVKETGMFDVLVEQANSSFNNKSEGNQAGCLDSDAFTDVPI